MPRSAFSWIAAAILVAGVPQAFASGCLPDREFAPRVVTNTNAIVTFQCDHASPLDLIRAVGFQTRIPIGIVLGADPNVLSRPRVAYDLDRIGAEEALETAVRNTGYSVERKDGVLVLTAGDLDARQRTLLEHSFPDFTPGENETMVGLGGMLTGWLITVIDPTAGFAGSIGGSTNDERFDFTAKPFASTEEIANAIVSQGTRGMWTFSAGSTSSLDYYAKVEVESYQHYTNMAISR